jgi:hypothetical protein
MKLIANAVSIEEMYFRSTAWDIESVGKMVNFHEDFELSSLVRLPRFA